MDVTLVCQTDGDSLIDGFGPIGAEHEAGVRQRLPGGRADALDPVADASA
jgi:hypothetical protein